MLIFRIVLVLAWAGLFYLTSEAVGAHGIEAGATTFIADFADGWRARYHADFALHLLLVAAWIVYREKYLAAGLALGLGVLAFGGMFTIAYVFTATFRTEEGFDGLVRGWRADAEFEL